MLISDGFVTGVFHSLWPVEMTARMSQQMDDSKPVRKKTRKRVAGHGGEYEKEVGMSPLKRDSRRRDSRIELQTASTPNLVTIVRVTACDDKTWLMSAHIHVEFQRSTSSGGFLHEELNSRLVYDLQY